MLGRGQVSKLKLARNCTQIYSYSTTICSIIFNADLIRFLLNTRGQSVSNRITLSNNQEILLGWPLSVATIVILCRRCLHLASTLDHDSGNLF